MNNYIITVLFVTKDGSNISLVIIGLSLSLEEIDPPKFDAFKVSNKTRYHFVSVICFKFCKHSSCPRLKQLRLFLLTCLSGMNERSMHTARKWAIINIIMMSGLTW